MIQTALFVQNAVDPFELILFPSANRPRKTNPGDPIRTTESTTWCSGPALPTQNLSLSRLTRQRLHRRHPPKQGSVAGSGAIATGSEWKSADQAAATCQTSTQTNLGLPSFLSLAQPAAAEERFGSWSAHPRAFMVQTSTQTNLGLHRFYHHDHVLRCSYLVTSSWSWKSFISMIYEHTSRNASSTSNKIVFLA